MQDQASGTDGSAGTVGMLPWKTGDTIPQTEGKTSISFSDSSVRSGWFKHLEMGNISWLGTLSWGFPSGCIY